MDDRKAWPSDDWFALLSRGDPDVVSEFWAIFGEPLRRVAERQISAALARRIDPDDIVQSACRTFFRRAKQGEFDCSDTDDLWRLMLTITLNKARMQARFQSRKRRQMSAERPLDAVADPAAEQFEQAIAAVDLADFLEMVFRQLDDESRDILQRSLDGQTQKEIAAALGCSERTVRRIKSRTREDLEAVLKEQLSARL
jgi:RNA polymerase sigma factor (sigma-70 family)